ncbi:MAG: dockerin type I domain-containing protein [Candidatus Omnitrophota bacterium]
MFHNPYRIMIPTPRKMGRKIAGFLAGLFLFAVQAGQAQNITPMPTKIPVDYAQKTGKKPTAIRALAIESQEISGARLEASSDSRIVFSSLADSSSDNKRFYYLDLKTKKIWDTEEDGVPGSVILPQDGRYMIFLHDEYSSNRDINGDGIVNTVLRYYHFDFSQKINIGVPARSATPLPGESRSGFEYKLNNNLLAFSISKSSNNLSYDKTAPWSVMDLTKFVYAIEGTPTPTPTPAKTPTPTPPLTATPTPMPTATPNLRTRADINGDGAVNAIDLLILRMFWFQ